MLNKIIGISALFLASKVEEVPRKLREFVKLVYHYVYRPRLEKEGRTVNDQEVVDEIQKKIIESEKLILKTIAFDINIDHPYSHLLRLIQEYQQILTNDDIKNHAWNCINDSYVIYFFNISIFNHIIILISNIKLSIMHMFNI